MVCVFSGRLAICCSRQTETAGIIETACFVCPLQTNAVERDAWVLQWLKGKRRGGGTVHSCLGQVLPVVGPSLQVGPINVEVLKFSSSIITYLQFCNSSLISRTVKFYIKNLVSTFKVVPCPLPFPCVCRKFESGNATNHTMEVRKRHSLAFYTVL